MKKWAGCNIKVDAVSVTLEGRNSCACRKEIFCQLAVMIADRTMELRGYISFGN